MEETYIAYSYIDDEKEILKITNIAMYNEFEQEMFKK